MNKRLIYGILCIILAGVIAFAGIPLLTARVNEKVTVIKVVEPIKKGAVIMEEQVREEEIGGYGLSPGTITDLQSVVGKYAATDLIPDMLLLPDNISGAPLSDSALSQLPAGKVAVSFTMKSLASSLSSKLLPGDIIRIYHYKSSAVAVPELQYVKVLSVTDDQGAEINQGDAAVPDETAKQAATAIVLATPAQAQVIAGLENDGEIHVALVYRGDSATADELIMRQDELLQTKE